MKPGSLQLLVQVVALAVELLRPFDGQAAHDAGRFRHYPVETERGVIGDGSLQARCGYRRGLVRVKPTPHISGEELRQEGRLAVDLVEQRAFAGRRFLPLKRGLQQAADRPVTGGPIRLDRAQHGCRAVAVGRCVLAKQQQQVKQPGKVPGCDSFLFRGAADARERRVELFFRLVPMTLQAGGATKCFGELTAELFVKLFQSVEIAASREHVDQASDEVGGRLLRAAGHQRIQRIEQCHGPSAGKHGRRDRFDQVLLFQDGVEQLENLRIERNQHAQGTIADQRRWLVLLERLEFRPISAVESDPHVTKLAEFGLPAVEPVAVSVPVPVVRRMITVLHRGCQVVETIIPDGLLRGVVGQLRVHGQLRALSGLHQKLAVNQAFDFRLSAVGIQFLARFILPPDRARS
jgi:hypothetical protein